MIHSEDSAVGAYRIWKPAKYLPDKGWTVQRLPDKTPELPNDRQTGETTSNARLKRNYKKYGSWEDLAESADIMVMQRSDKPEVIALAMAIRDIYGIPVVYEIDDNIYDVSKNSPSYKYWFPGSPMIQIAETFMSNVDAISTTTPQLVDAYKHLNPNIFVLPNCQDLDDWEGIANNTSNDKITLGWAGGQTHYDDLKLIARPIKKILREFKNVEFKIIGTIPDFLRDVPGVITDFGIVGVNKWPEKLASMGFDIGLAPVVDRPFNQGKSNIKWQEYSMLEIPTIASRVGPYLSIDHEETGLLAYNDESSWELQMRTLIKDAQLRRRLGESAKRKVVSDYNIKENIWKWDAAYKNIINSFKPVSS